MALTSAMLQPISAAAARPCTARAASSDHSVGAAPHQIDASRNNPSAGMNTRRCPILPASAARGSIVATIGS
ncbi:hypothetical protein G6F23_016112 [Rhizopus arrhizus]|nr:hypothetical protein G6F23_016112 [Rhizopus arrhizus]